MTKPWLRLYRDALNNPKIGTLGFEATGMWAICLMLSDDEGNLPDEAGIAWASRSHVDGVTELMACLLRNGLVTRYGNGYRLHDWAQHQRNSDYDTSGAERQKRFRERQKAQSSAVTDSNALRNASVTLPDTDTDTEKNRTSLRSVTREGDGPAVPVVVKPQRASKAPGGSSWPADAVIPDQWQHDARLARQRAGKGDINYQAEAERFANHFAANGKRMKDWRRAWLNWATSPYVDQLKGAGNAKGKPGRGAVLRDIAGEIRAAEAADGRGGDLQAAGARRDDLGDGSD
jgi:hypothetical protein